MCDCAGADRSRWIRATPLFPGPGAILGSALSKQGCAAVRPRTPETDGAVAILVYFMCGCVTPTVISSHFMWFCVAGVALMALGGTFDLDLACDAPALAWQPSTTPMCLCDVWYVTARGRCEAVVKLYLL